MSRAGLNAAVVLRVGDAKCRVTLMPHTMTAAESEAVLKTIRSSRFFEREKALYSLRRQHVKAAAGLNAEETKTRTRKEATLIRAKTQNLSSPQPATQRESRILHKLPSEFRCTRIERRPVPIKSIEFDDVRSKNDAEDIRTEALKTYAGWFSASHSPSDAKSPMEPLSPASPVIALPTERHSVRRCEGNCGAKTRDVCFRARPSSQPYHSGHYTSITPQLVSLGVTPASSAFPPGPVRKSPLPTTQPSKLSVDFRQTFSSWKADTPEPSASDRPVRKSVYSRTLQLPPRDLPPHRIPVDFSLFRRVFKQSR